MTVIAMLMVLSVVAGGVRNVGNSMLFFDMVSMFDLGFTFRDHARVMNDFADGNFDLQEMLMSVYFG